jgi:hypothetical protein
MSIRVTCPNCQAVAACPDDYRGKAVRCKKCGRSFVAGAPATRPAAVPRRPVPTAVPAGKRRRGRFFIAASLAAVVGVGVGLPAAYLALKKSKPPDEVAARPQARSASEGAATQARSASEGTSGQAPAPPPATERQERPRDTGPAPKPVTAPAAVKEKPVAAPAVAKEKPAPKAGLADLVLAPPAGWRADFNKFIPAWLVTKPSATGRVEGEVLRIEECPEDARTPADYAAHLKEKDFLNIDLPGWVEVGAKGELPDGFCFKGVVKKYGNPKTPPVLGLVAVRDVGGLKVRCFSANLRNEASRDEALETFTGARLVIRERSP